MKPRLRMDRGVWVCSRMIGLVGLWPIGHGYTPQEAFAEWQEQEQGDA